MTLKRLPLLPLLISLMLGCLGMPQTSFANPRPNLYLLSVGVGHYQDRAFQPLHFVDDDVQSLHAWASSQQNTFFHSVHSRSLLHEQATRAHIVQALLTFYQQANAQDLLILYLAGHGAVETRTGAWHFLPFDALSDNVAGSGLEQGDLLRKIEAGTRQRPRVLVLVDVCFSGALAQELALAPVPMPAPLRETPSPRSYNNTSAAAPAPAPAPAPAQKRTTAAAPAQKRTSTPTASTQGRGVQVALEAPQLSQAQAQELGAFFVLFAASSATTQARESQSFKLPWESASVQGHGLFTAALLDALHNADADVDLDGTIRLAELRLHVDKHMRRSEHGAQRPILSGWDTDAVISALPHAQERCDGLDNNFNGRIDENFPDSDADGKADCLEQELCNGSDDNDNGSVDEGFDQDRDGYRSILLCGSTFGSDCDDSDVSIHPEQRDWGNLRDDDCDGAMDEEDFDLAPCDGIPDRMNGGIQSAKRRWLISLTTGLAFGTVGLLTGYQSWRLLPGQSGDYEAGVVAEPLNLLMHAAVTGGAGFVLGTGFSFQFGRHETHLREQIPPGRAERLARCATAPPQTDDRQHDLLNTPMLQEKHR